MDETNEVYSNGGFNTQRRRIKKSLNLAEKIAVIDMYKETPNTRTLAHMFQCGRTQIQNILRHQHKYIEDWQNKADPFRLRRAISAHLMAHRAVIFEWLQRCRCYPIKLTDVLIREKAIIALQLMHVTEFRINKEWLKRFKNKFKLNDDDLFNNDMNYMSDQPQKSLDLQEIINEMNANGSLYGFNSPKQKALTRKTYTQDDSNFDNMDQQATEMETTMDPSDYVEILTDSSESDCSFKNEFHHTEYTSNTNDSSSKDSLTSVSNVEAKEIQNYRDALNFLGPLEQFALFKENIRAVGLINQLENIFRDEMSKSSRPVELDNN